MVVGNGVGGTKRVWKPVTRNQVHPDSAFQALLSGSNWRAGACSGAYDGACFGSRRRKPWDFRVTNRHAPLVW
jgi:hypothetical protein